MRLDPDGALLATKYRARLIYIFFNYCCGFLKPGLTTPAALFLEVHKSYLFHPPAYALETGKQLRKFQRIMRPTS
jgi:hypothetical protein